jgi:hypothetical protein
LERFNKYFIDKEEEAVRLLVAVGSACFLLEAMPLQSPMRNH